jgi:uncharacterized membrane protein
VDYGINDEFIRWPGATLESRPSALFMLVHRCTPDKDVAKAFGFFFGAAVLALLLRIQLTLPANTFPDSDTND